MPNHQCREEIQEYLEFIGETCSCLLELKDRLPDAMVKNSLKKMGVYEEGGKYRFDLGTVEYYNIFLQFGQGNANISAATNCHYITLSRIKHMVPKIREFSEKLGEEIEKLEKLAYSA